VTLKRFPLSKVHLFCQNLHIIGLPSKARVGPPPGSTSFRSYNSAVEEPPGSVKDYYRHCRSRYYLLACDLEFFYNIFRLFELCSPPCADSPARGDFTPFYCFALHYGRKIPRSNAFKQLGPRGKQDFGSYDGCYCSLGSNSNVSLKHEMRTLW
jgi:hypothetical protein